MTPPKGNTGQKGIYGFCARCGDPCEASEFKESPHGFCQACGAELAAEIEDVEATNQPAKVTPSANFTVEYSKAVLESLVEQGMPLVFQSDEPRTFLLPLVEGAKAVLDEYKNKGPNGLSFGDDQHYGGQRNLIRRMARAYAPRMLEAGMTLPEAPE